MVRQNKTGRRVGRFDETVMREAVNSVINDNKTIRSAAKEKNLSFQTLSRYVKKFKEDPSCRMAPNYKVNQIFSKELEKALIDYIFQCSKMFYGLTITDCRKLAYDLAKANNLSIPHNWEEAKKASVDWYKGFRKRHPNLSLRTPEGCSLARAIGFNKVNVDLFFEKLENVLKRHPNFSTGLRIYNLDETGTLTVQNSAAKVLAEKGTKQVSKIQSSERGTLVTTCCIVNASGHAIPPVMVFPRVHFKSHMITGAPPGTLGLATKSGWMNTECFIEVLKHFIKHTASSSDNPSLLIMDNHESHISIEGLNLCKNYGVTVLTVPPHCTHKLQPLDVGLLKPFHVFYNDALSSWEKANPGTPVTIYQVASFVGIAYPRAMTPVNIGASFKKTGIFPFDKHVFTEEDFVASQVTERDFPTETPVVYLQSPSTSRPLDFQQQPERTPPKDADAVLFVSPSDVRGYPKRSESTVRKNTRRKGRTMVATDTPEKEEIEAYKMDKTAKMAVKRNLKATDDMDVVESEEEDPEQFSVHDSDSSVGDEHFLSEEEDNLDVTLPPAKLASIKCGDFLLVRLEYDASSNKTIKKYFVGQVLLINNNETFELQFLRKSTKNNTCFVFPIVEDISPILNNQIVKILDAPKISRGRHFFSNLKSDFLS